MANTAAAYKAHATRAAKRADEARIEAGRIRAVIAELTEREKQLQEEIAEAERQGAAFLQEAYRADLEKKAKDRHEEYRRRGLLAAQTRKDRAA